MRVVFMGNHTVGVHALDALRRSCDVAAVVAHPPDVEDGVRYKSVYDFAAHRDIPVKRLRPTDAEFNSFIHDAKPDLIWLTDYRYIIPIDCLSIARLGAINLHPSLLPEYRGRAPLNWAVINGESRLGLTAHFVSETVDAGDIVMQRAYNLRPDEDVGDALMKLYPLYETVTAEVIAAFINDTVRRTPQPTGHHKVYPARKPDDGWIDWRKSASQIHNLIRGVARPYPGALGFVGEKRVTIWKCSIRSICKDASPGTVLSITDDNTFEVACGDGALIVTDYSIDSGRNLETLSASDTFALEKKLAVSVG